MRNGNVALGSRASRADATVAVETATILLVEDETFVRNIAGELLELAGYRVMKVRSSLEAMRAFRESAPEVQLLVTDVVLPGRNGHDLARDLRALSPPLKVIFMSGYPTTIGSRDELREPGVYYLTKPFSVASLMQKVTDALAVESRPRTNYV